MADSGSASVDKFNSGRLRRRNCLFSWSRVPMDPQDQVFSVSTQVVRANKQIQE
jgi:hypothetical protein